MKNLIRFDITLKNNQSLSFLEFVARIDDASLEWLLKIRDWFAFNFSLFSSFATLFITLCGKLRLAWLFLLFSPLL